VFHLAQQAERGIVVCLGPDDEVREARRLTRDLDNVMFVPAAPEEIPWQDGFFSLIIADNPTPEIRRVLAEAGRIVSTR
jgi:hypothetical protein